MAKSKLEIAADEARAENLIKNEYQESNPYDDTHKDALSDGDEKGKGTGVYIDTTDGGSSVDINGNGKHSGKSGRKGNIAINESKNGSVEGVNGYGPDKPYTTPIID
jgi:hypothetical protein